MASEIKVDTISEKTSTNGVTIDSVSLKDGKVATANSIDSDAYVDGSIDTAHIADDQVTLAKMAGGTDGNIISYDASGDPVAIATGSDGQVLTSTGAGSPPAFEAAAGGKIGQVVSAVKTDTTTSTSTSLADVTGMTVAITPAATSSKVLVLVTTSMCNIASGRQSTVSLLRDSTEICRGDAAGSRPRDTFAFYGEFARDIHQVGINFLDSPSSTSELTYKLQWSTESGGTNYLNRTSADTDAATHSRTASTITVMEVLA